MNGWDMTLLRSRIADAGYSTHQFSYKSTSTNIDQIIFDLNEFVEKIDAEKVHFVCHSLGGLVVRHFFDRYPKEVTGRIVTLGSPHKGSNAAHFLNRFSLTSKILGESLNAGLLGNAPLWSGERELGSVAGTASFGMGKLFPDLKEPNDGTVSVEETILENTVDQIQLPVSHVGLLMSKNTADETLHFIKYGNFTNNYE